MTVMGDVAAFGGSTSIRNRCLVLFITWLLLELAILANSTR
jgi:hypothetical protein